MDADQVQPPLIRPGALDAWRDFPAGTHPRPIVLIGSVVLNPGYATVEAKTAGMEAGYSLPAALPAPLSSRATVALPDGTATLPLVDAATAALTLRRDVSRQPRGTPLPIVAVAFGSATFRTDRGHLPLPAWLFTAQDGLGPMAVPAVAAGAFWRFADDWYAGVGGVARVLPDGRRLTVPVMQPACAPVPMIPIVVETPGAVAVTARAARPVEPNGCMVRHVSAIAVELAEALGDRVLVDGHGYPYQVVPAERGGTDGAGRASDR